MPQIPFSSTDIKSNLKDIIHTANCPACGYYVAVEFYDGGKQPLTTLAWPKSSESASLLKRLPLSFVRCVDCGHVYNRDFDYAEVPYSEKPSLMFNKGEIWRKHLEKVSKSILQRLPEEPTVIEIGCGDGHLIHYLADASSEGRFIGFDPNASIKSIEKIETVNALFDPAVHLELYKPDLIISRHVLEHMINPLGFVQSLAFAASWLNIETALFIEVPCIDRVFSTGRTTDFFYEHNSHFTTASLTRMLLRSSSRIELVEKSYNDEVVYAIAHIGGKQEQKMLADVALSFDIRSRHNRESVCRQLQELYQTGKRIALWGGVGKSATFINCHGMDKERFPLVVDSDPEKWGTFVPGTGQEISSPNVLSDQPLAHVIIITTQWRASDIVLEIERLGIKGVSILLEHDGNLIDYFEGDHPYRINNKETECK